MTTVRSALAINEPFNDDVTTDSALRLQPNIDFMFSNILSHLHPIAPPIPATFIDTSHISSITVDFHLFDLDRCCTCDWTAFDNLASSLAHLEKVVFGFRCQDDLRQFTALPDRLTKLSETDKIRYGYWDESRELWMHLLQADADEFIPSTSLAESVNPILTPCKRSFRVSRGYIDKYPGIQDTKHS